MKKYFASNCTFKIYRFQPQIWIKSSNRAAIEKVFFEKVTGVYKKMWHLKAHSRTMSCFHGRKIQTEKSSLCKQCPQKLTTGFWQLPMNVGRDVKFWEILPFPLFVGRRLWKSFEILSVRNLRMNFWLRLARKISPWGLSMFLCGI